MPITFVTVAQFQVAFLDKTFRTMYILFGSAEVHIFPLFSIVFADGIIMTSFIVTWVLNLYILSNFE